MGASMCTDEKHLPPCCAPGDLSAWPRSVCKYDTSEKADGYPDFRQGDQSPAAIPSCFTDSKGGKPLAGGPIAVETVVLDVINSYAEFGGAAMGDVVEDTDAATIEKGGLSAPNSDRHGGTGAVSGATEEYVEEYVEVRLYVEPSHCCVKWLFSLVALSLVTSSTLCVFNLWEPSFAVWQYCTVLYNIVFAFIIVIMDGGMYGSLTCVQARLFRIAPCLASQKGKASFAFYVGSINLVMLPKPDVWWWAFVCIGGALCVSGILMFFQNVGRSGAVAKKKQTAQQAHSAAAAIGGAQELGYDAVPVFGIKLQDNHCILKMWCSSVAFLLLATSLLQLVNVSMVSAKPFDYLFIIYNVVYAVIILMIDATPAFCERYGDPRREFVQFAAGFAQQRVRGLFSWYVGSINLALAPSAPNAPFLSFLGLSIPDVPGLPSWAPNTFWGKMYFLIGAGLCVSGVLMFVQACLRPVTSKAVERLTRKLPPV
jgi:hypothetical protein